MAIKSVTPIMTSNTTPKPYRVSSSGKYSVPYDAWKAFNGTNVDEFDCWHSDYCKSGWIIIDFGSSVAVSGVELTSRNDATWVFPFKRFEVHGCMDGVGWKTISSFDEGISPNGNTKKTFNFGKMYNYRFYRIYVPESVSSRIAIAEINFICDTSLKDEKINFYKTLSKNVPSSLEDFKNEVHFTEKGEIFTYDVLGNRIKLGSQRSNITKSEW